MKIAVVFSTLSGTTLLISENIVSYLKDSNHKVKLFDAMSVDPDDLKDYDLVFFGSSTYGNGDLNPITELFLSTADSQRHNCNNTRFAFFSLGDSSYPNFSTSGQLSSEKISSMNGNVLKPIFKIDGYPNEDTFKGVREWVESIIEQLK